MRYLSVCSGIEAATVAWRPIGWSPAGFSEIDAFPCAVLAHHYPSVPNLGNMTLFQEWPDAAIDILVGGTPCQSFSVAGLREGLADPRGNLALTYLAIAARYRPEWMVWENVPGVRSQDEGRAFGAILGGMGKLGYGWAYRSFDAQYFNLAQRRERVFVVANIGGWRRAAAVLFEREGLRGDLAPSRKAGKDVAPTLSSRSQGGGGLGTDCDVDGGLISHCLKAQDNPKHDPTHETYVTHSLRGDGHDASEDGTGRGVPLVPMCFDETQITSAENRSNPQPNDPSHPLAAAGRPPTIAFDCKASGRNGFGIGHISPTLRAMGHKDSHGNAGGQVAVAFDLRGREGGAQFEGPHDTANIRAASGGSSRSYVCDWGVRRLTPRECERLQGFPDDYTLIPYRGALAKDSPRYKALGNSMAVPVMRWLGRRIQMVHELRVAA